MKHNVKEKDTVGMTTAENEVKNISRKIYYLARGEGGEPLAGAGQQG